jgi:hypothetical protein
MANKSSKGADAIGRDLLGNRIEERWGKEKISLSTDRIVSELGDVPRYEVVLALKDLERKGKGTFSVGRTGQKAQFVWAKEAPRGAVKQGPKDGLRKKEQVNDVAIRAARSVPKVRRDAPEAAGSTPKTEGTERSSSEPVAQAPAGSEPSLIHSFHLRPSLVVQVALPSDVTPFEVQRLSQFLQALPFVEPASER